MTPLQCKSPVPTTGCSSTFYALRNMAASGRCTRVFHPFVVKGKTCSDMSGRWLRDSSFSLSEYSIAQCIVSQVTYSKGILSLS